MLTSTIHQDAPLLANRACNAVLEAVRILSASKARNGGVLLEEGRDIKLEADLLLSRELTSRLTGATGIPCVCEEDLESHGIPETGPVWIVDPLDGSMNFSRGLPLYGVSVALWQNGDPFIGIIHDMERLRTLCAWNGRAWAGETALSIGTVQTMDRAVLATGFPVMMDTSPDTVKAFLTFASRFKKVRMLGTAALSMAWVAEGRLDAYFERDIMVWDVAAGAALVRGAGGMCVMRQGRHPMSLDVVAANPALTSAMQRALGWR